MVILDTPIIDEILFHVKSVTTNTQVDPFQLNMQFPLVQQRAQHIYYRIAGIFRSGKGSFWGEKLNFVSFNSVPHKSVQAPSTYNPVLTLALTGNDM